MLMQSNGVLFAKELALIIPSLTSAGENRMLKAGYGCDLGEGGNMKLQAAFPLSVSIKTLRKAFAIVCNEKFLVKAFFQLELRYSLPLESNSLEFGSGLGSKSSAS